MAPRDRGRVGLGKEIGSVVELRVPGTAGRPAGAGRIAAGPAEGAGNRRPDAREDPSRLAENGDSAVRPSSELMLPVVEPPPQEPELERRHRRPRFREELPLLGL